MSETPTKEQAAERGRRAQELLDNPLLNESAQALKAKYFEEWAKTTPEDVPGRERLYTAYTMVDQIYNHLRVLIGDGKIAAQQIDKLKKAR